MANTTPSANPTLTDEQKKQLLERQFQTAMAGSEMLLIHLGKTELGQAETTRHQHEVMAVPMQEKSYEQLLDLLEERQKQIPDERLVAELGQMMATAQAPALPAPVAKKRRKKAS